MSGIRAWLRSVFLPGGGRGEPTRPALAGRGGSPDAKGRYTHLGRWSAQALRRCWLDEPVPSSDVSVGGPPGADLKPGCGQNRSRRGRRSYKIPGFARSRPGGRSYKRLQGNKTNRNPAHVCSHDPNPEPASASPAASIRYDRHAPAPTTIEAAMHSSPVSQSRTRRSHKKIRNRNPMPDTKPQTPPTGTANSCRL